MRCGEVGFGWLGRGKVWYVGVWSVVVCWGEV